MLVRMSLGYWMQSIHCFRMFHFVMISGNILTIELEVIPAGMRTRVLDHNVLVPGGMHSKFVKSQETQDSIKTDILWIFKRYFIKNKFCKKHFLSNLPMTYTSMTKYKSWDTMFSTYICVCLISRRNPHLYIPTAPACGGKYDIC